MTTSFNPNFEDMREIDNISITDVNSNLSVSRPIIPESLLTDSIIPTNNDTPDSMFNLSSAFTDEPLSNSRVDWTGLDVHNMRNDSMSSNTRFIFQNDLHSYNASELYSDTSLNSQVVTTLNEENYSGQPSSSPAGRNISSVSSDIPNAGTESFINKGKTAKSHNPESSDVPEISSLISELELQEDNGQKESGEVEAGPSRTSTHSQGNRIRSSSTSETSTIKIKSSKVATAKIIRNSKRKGSEEDQLAFNKKRKMTPLVSDVATELSKQVSPKKRKVFTPASITAALRQKVLTRLLEEHQVIEHSAELVKLYQQTLAKESNVMTTPHVIDKKTLQRAAAAMEEKGLLKTYNVSLPLLNGGSNTKLLFLHPSLTPSSPIVKEYVTKMLDRAILIGRSFKPSKIEEVNIEVEPLEEFQRRVAAEAAAGEKTITLEVPSESNTNPSNSCDALLMNSTAPEGLMGNLPGTEHVNKTLQTSNEMWWLHTARGYGWINAKMIRAKILHQYLISKLFDENYIDKNSRTFHTAILIRDLPLDLYLKIIGQSIPSQALTNYVCSGQSLDVSVIDLPSELRASLFSGNYKFRQNLKRLIDILVALRILKPIRRVFNESGDPVLDVDSDNADNFKFDPTEWSSKNATSCSPPQTLLAPAYQLLRHVPMFDFSVA
ncbi:18507_t:CDS:1, partial [Acaulospora morrowiae]